MLSSQERASDDSDDNADKRGEKIRAHVKRMLRMLAAPRAEEQTRNSNESPPQHGDRAD